MDYLRKEGNMALAVTGREQEFADAKIAALHYRILEEINDPSPLALADVTIGFIRSGCSSHMRDFHCLEIRSMERQR